MSLLNTLVRRKNVLSVATRRATPRFVGMLEDLEQRSLFSAAYPSMAPSMGPIDDPNPPGGVESDEYEPNNTIADATDLPLGSYPLGNLTINGTSAASQRDVDYFRIYAPSNGLITIDEIGATVNNTALNLNIYNSAGTLITTGTASGSTGRSATISVQAGQSYYAKVSGSNSYGYAIQANYVSANFAWAMPNTFGSVRDQFGQPVIDNTAGYVQRDPITLGGKTVFRFPTRFSGTSRAGSGATYSWHVAGTASDANSAYSADFTGFDTTVNLPNGKYDVTLTVTNNGVSLSSTQNITVRNYLLVAVGDSYSSGEGNPHDPQAYDIFGFTTHGASWAQGGDDNQSYMSRMAHRSSKAAVAQAAFDIENGDSHSSVTFIFLSQSGARIDWGMLTSKDSAEAGAPGTLPAQMDLLAQTVGSRHIDALTMSIGGNDIGFGDIFGGLVDADPVYDPVTYLDDLEDVFTTAEAKIADLGAKYAQLNDRLKQFDIGQVFMTEYPDLTKDGHGNYAEYLGDIAPFMEADPGELKKAVDRLMVPFVTTMRTAAYQFGWSYVGSISDQFANGGYGGYGQIVQTAQGSILAQGPMGWNGNVSNPLVVKETKGMMHPIGMGLTIQKNAILDAWRKPELRIENWNIGSDAMLPNANNGYSFTVRNASFLATSGANIAAVYAAPTAKVTVADGYKLTDMLVHMLGPNETQSFSGILPATNDPFRNGTNAIYIGAIADAGNDIPNEANELNNNPLGPTRFTSDRDVKVVNNTIWLNLPDLTVGSPVYGSIGKDEIIGGYDIDSYKFFAAKGARIQFNVNSSTGLDTYIKIFKLMPTGDNYYTDFWTGEQAFITGNDDGAAPGEAADTKQSFLDWTFADSAEYAIQICHKVNGGPNIDQFNFAGRKLGDTGDYSIGTTELAVDTTPPKVVQQGYDWNNNKVWFQFDEAINPSIALAALQLTDRSHGNASVTSPATAVSYNAATKTVTFTLRNNLADADYRATLPAGTFSDAAGNASKIAASADLFVMAGDANHDRAVNFDDLVIMAQNYSKTGRTFAQGNFDRSPEGNVNFDDLTILARQYNKKLTAPAALASAATFNTTPVTIKRTQPASRIAGLI